MGGNFGYRLIAAVVLLVFCASSGASGNDGTSSLQGCLVQLAAAVKPAQRSHPDAVTPEGLKTLPAGSPLYLYESGLVNTPAYGGKNDRIVTAKFEKLEGAGECDQCRGQYKSETPIVRLKVRGHGTLHVPFFMLENSAFTARDFQERAPFALGELVEVGLDSMDGPLRLRLAGSEAVLTVPGEPLNRLYPLPAHFVSNYDRYHYLVQLPMRIDQKVDILQLLAPHAWVTGYGSGSRTSFLRALRTLDSLEVALTPGQAVRYRGKQGEMTMGTLVSQGAWGARVQHSEGLPNLTTKVVFPHRENLAPSSHRELGGKSLKARDSAIVSFLNTGARLTSHPDFKGMGPREKINVMTRYLNLIVPWKSSAARRGYYSLPDLENRVCIGGAVCTERAPLLGALFSEAGYRVRDVSGKHGGFNRNGFNFHQWLEVDFPVAERTETWVIDPDSEYAAPLAEVLDGNGHLAHWYRTPADRSYDYESHPTSPSIDPR